MVSSLCLCELFMLLQSPPSHTAVVKTSYVRVKQEEDDEKEEDCVCFTVGKNLFYFTYTVFKQVKFNQLPNNKNFSYHTCSFLL